MLENIRAGLIPFNIKDDQIFICLMKPSNSEFGGTEYQLAKGHREVDEPDKDCAVREAIEELGLLPEHLTPPFHVNDVKKISWWAAEYTSFELGEHSAESAEVRWFTLSEAFDIIRDWQKGILGKFAFKLRERHPNRKLF